MEKDPIVESLTSNPIYQAVKGELLKEIKDQPETEKIDSLLLAGFRANQITRRRSLFRGFIYGLAFATFIALIANL